MALQGCAHKPVASASSAVAVDARVAPPADLLICPARPTGFPADGEATIPAPVRAAIVRLASAYAAATGQLERLIGWETGTACPPPAH